jgi:hypothetical protein
MTPAASTCWTGRPTSCASSRATARTTGRSGGGPGEYSNANGLAWLSPDTLVVIDQRGNRYNILSRDGDYVRDVQRRLPFYGWVFFGGYHEGRIYEQFNVGSGPDARPVLLGTALGARRAVLQDPPQPGAEPGAARADTRMDTLFLPATDRPPFESFSIRTERGGMVMGVPFAPGQVYHLDHTGTLWHGHGSEFRVFRSTLDGDTLMEILLDAVPAPVSAEELAEWESGAGPTRFREMGGRLDMSRIPRTKPYFDDLYLDPDGFLRPVVRNARLHVVGRDELDVQGVYVFDIAR